MVEVEFGVGVVAVAHCKDSYGVDAAVCAGFGEGVEGGCGCGFDGGVRSICGGESLGHGDS